MDVRIVSTTEGLEDLQQPWERLEQQDPDTTFYITFRYIKAWWDSFCAKPGLKLHIACVLHNQAVVGIGPLVVTEQRKGPVILKMLEFAGRGDYFNFLVDRTLNPQTIIKYIFKALEENGDWDIVRMTNIPGHSQLAAYLFKSKDNPYFRHQIENPYADLSGYSDFAGYKAGNLPTKVIKLRNKLEREVGFQFQAVPGNRDGIFARISQLHRLEKQYLVKQMGKSHRHSLFEDKYISQFVRKVFEGTDNVLTFVYSDREGNMLGYKTCYLFNRVALSWNGAYHPEFNKYSIGKIFYHDILEYIMDNKLADCFDWGAGRYQWKFEWTNTFTSTYKYEKPLTKKGRGFLKSRALFQALKQIRE